MLFSLPFSFISKVNDAGMASALLGTPKIL